MLLATDLSIRALNVCVRTIELNLWQTSVDELCTAGEKVLKMSDLLKRCFSGQGPLRIVLVIFTAALVLVAPFAFADRAMSGWRLYTTIIAPALVPPMFFVYPLDMTMCRVKMDGASDAEKDRLRRGIYIGVWQLALLFLAWLPFFWRLLDPKAFASFFQGIARWL